MAVDAAQFLIDYPEFEPLHQEDAAMVEAACARAERRIGDTWDANVRDDIVKLQAAAMLANTPAGRAARLSEPGMESSYHCELKERKKAHAYANTRVTL